ncbi:hypothetical protein OFAG_01133 [Oxalobacter formigenes HOxBLS]|uniref:Uncharacterized protein n=1 Tax=Oxalobacter paraformigenes TaxID=556268 RepID=C3X444_9BURK|nr:hypothetical protein [Oxalobacter paraformigenes]EEO27980.2 hypothetical protein OFAG_01133 [Oxalobacter paraformigenes]
MNRQKGLATRHSRFSPAKGIVKDRTDESVTEKRMNKMSENPANGFPAKGRETRFRPVLSKNAHRAFRRFGRCVTGKKPPLKRLSQKAGFQDKDRHKKINAPFNHARLHECHTPRSPAFTAGMPEIFMSCFIAGGGKRTGRKQNTLPEEKGEGAETLPSGKETFPAVFLSSFTAKTGVSLKPDLPETALF